MSTDPELEQYRAAIDAADADIARAFVKRMRAVAGVAACKIKNGRAILCSEREKQVEEQFAAAAEQEGGSEFYAEVRELIRQMIRIGRDYQQKQDSSVKK